MGLRGPVLAAADFSETADAALREAHTLAAELRAPFVVCHVLPEAFKVRVLFPQDAGLDLPVQEQLEAKAREAISQRIERVTGHRPSREEIDIAMGTPHAGILEAADRLGAGVIVLGPGATAQRVARAASGPVLIARPSPTRGSVLAGTDFSDPSLPAVHMAADEARRRGTRFRVVHCLETDEIAYLGSVGLPDLTVAFPLPQSVIDQLEAGARERLAAALGSINIVSEAVVLRRSPTAGIVEAANAEKTALIVVGTRGRSGLARLVLGSVAEAVITHAPCSVLVVPLHPA